MGARGPAPKRSDQRRRRNKPADGKGVRKAPSGGAPKPQAAKKDWHPVAKRWYQSLGKSGQSVFYEESDWATAFVIAESMSRDLKPQPIGVHPETGKAVMASIPLKGASLQAYLKAMSMLMVTETERRRAGVELELSRGEGGEPEEPSGVTKLDKYRDRARSAGGKT